MSSVDSPPQAAPDPAAAQLLFQAATGYIVSASLHVAVRLDIVERLSDGPKAVRDLAAEAGVPEDGLCRVLRALSTAGIFAEVAPKTFALTPGRARGQYAAYLEADRSRDDGDAGRPRANGAGVRGAIRERWLRSDTRRAHRVDAVGD